MSDSEGWRLVDWWGRALDICDATIRRTFAVDEIWITFSHHKTPLHLLQVFCNETHLCQPSWTGGGTHDSQSLHANNSEWSDPLLKIFSCQSMILVTKIIKNSEYSVWSFWNTFRSMIFRLLSPPPKKKLPKCNKCRFCLTSKQTVMAKSH